MKLINKAVFILLPVIFLIPGFVFFLVFILPYPTIRMIGDFLSPDKNLESLTPAIISRFHIPSLIAAIILIVAGTGMILWRRRLRGAIDKVIKQIRRFGDIFSKDTHLFFHDTWLARPNRSESVILMITVIGAAIARLMFINRSIEFDEAYTFVEFARFPFRYIASTYYVPNNQVFHTILVRISYLLFGDHVWQIRLPTFIASLVLILCVYFLGRSLYNRQVGLVAAGIVAFLPDVILRSVSARGYILVTLMALLALLMAIYVIRKKNLLAWLFLIIFCTIGFYTIPMMIYPCGLIFLWLLIAGVTENTNREYTSPLNWIKYLVIAGLSIVILTVVLYAPIFLSNDLSRIYESNRVLQPMNSIEFFSSFPATFHTTVRGWLKGIPGLISGTLLIGLFLSFFFHKRVSKFRIPMQIVFSVYIVIMLLIERPYPIARIWLWVIPFMTLWCTAGIVGGLQWITQKLSSQYLAPLALAVMLLGFAINGMYQSYIGMAIYPTAEDPVAEEVTLFLKPQLTENDLVVVSNCANARYWYYFSLYNIPDIVIRNRDRFFTRVFIIAYIQANPSCGNEDLLDVFSKYGPDAVFFDLDTLRLIKQFDYAAIYEIDPVLERIQKAYPNH